MKKILASILMLSLVGGFTGCGDKEAQEYAAKLIPVLDAYQEQLSQKIKADQNSYEELAQAYEEARKADVRIRLTRERSRRAEDLGERFSNAREAPTFAQILAPVQEYAKSDFETTQSLLQEGLDARSKYLADLENLEIELQKLKVLKKALQELAEAKSDFRQFKNATDFLLKTDEAVVKLFCADLKKQLDQLNKEVTAAQGDEKKKLQQKIAQTKERMATKKCPNS
jgi:DNA repair exonuclease SbcCD ATPase subunit